jgi:quinone-modifying oxidoreductase subunit QmoA
MKGKVARIDEDPVTRSLVVEAEDILRAEKTTVTVDLVVLATGMAPSLRGAPGPAIPGLTLDGDGFVVPGGRGAAIFAAGSARDPADVATATQQGTAAAMMAIQAIESAARA